MINEEAVAAPALRNSSKLITFLDARGTVISDGSQDKAYTIEPEKPDVMEPLSSSTDDSVGHVPLEPTTLTTIPEHKPTHPSDKKPDGPEDSTDYQSTS